ncbi:MAG: pyridoxamine 5'-phosphate oxidase [Motiliproteus sp.]|jgi:pyridoxamine 5'-phosphate oxidase
MEHLDDLSAIRREYRSEPFTESELDADPIKQFARWFTQHRQLDPDNATVMVLATASAEGSPAARIVLLKHYDADGFGWYSDYGSHKGQALATNPHAELLFYWPELDRQVRISGPVRRLDRANAQRYFSERPRGSQLSAAASEQSQPVADREQLTQQVDALSARYTDEAIPCPERWGGYQLEPQRYEFWQGRENRLHDRLVYTLTEAVWGITRLAP